MAPGIELLPDERITCDFDITVVGAGIFGSLLAHQAAQAFPGCRIALFESGTVGGGCSGAAGALATPAVRSERVRGISDVSREWYERYLETYATAPMRRLPILYVSMPDTACALVSRLSPGGTQASAGALPEWIETGDAGCIAAAQPALWADVRSLCRHLLSNSPDLQVYEGAQLLEYDRQETGWLVRVADGRRFRSRQLVLAKGAGFSSAERSELPSLRNKKIVAFLLDWPAHDDSVVVYFHDHESFLLPLPAQNCWLLSIVSPHWDCAAAGAELQASEADRLIASELLALHAPALLPALRGARVHCDGYLDGHLPQVSLVDGAIFLLGGSGSGFRYAPGVAAEAMEVLRARVSAGSCSQETAGTHDAPR